MTDADVDGAHIRTLLLTFFYRNMPSLVENGNIYIAQPPLYKITKGKESKYAYSDDEKVSIMAEMGVTSEQMQVVDEVSSSEEPEVEETEEIVESEKETKKIKKPSKPGIQRYKGLGEMNPQQLWETTMEPKNRILLQVTVDDAAKADEVFTTLMGDEVPPRKRFIQAHAKTVKNLDI